MDKQQKIQKVGEYIKGIKHAMLVTMNEQGEHTGRPMSTQEVEFDGTIWFMTSKDSRKVEDIKHNPQVGLMYGDAGVKFVSLAGKAELSDDKAKIKELWTDFYKAWFDDENDPSIVLIKVNVTGAEYWDYKGGKLGVYKDMAKAAITGDMADSGINEKIQF